MTKYQVNMNMVRPKVLPSSLCPTNFYHSLQRIYRKRATQGWTQDNHLTEESIKWESYNKHLGLEPDFSEYFLLGRMKVALIGSRITYSRIPVEYKIGYLTWRPRITEPLHFGLSSVMTFKHGISLKLEAACYLLFSCKKPCLVASRTAVSSSRVSGVWESNYSNCRELGHT